MSKESFSEEQIPWFAELENAILSSAGRNGELNNATDRVLKKRGLERNSLPSPPWLQLRVLSLSYLILVFPKEFWRRIDTNSTNDLIQVLNFEENVLRKKDPHLKKMRNAIAHADIKLSEREFKYRENKKTPYITITFEQLSRILYRLTTHYTELALPPGQHQHD